MKLHNEPMIKITDAVEHFGSKAALARTLDVTPGAVSKWSYDGLKHLPVKQAYRLMRMYPGIFKKMAKYGDEVK